MPKVQLEFPAGIAATIRRARRHWAQGVLMLGLAVFSADSTHGDEKGDRWKLPVEVTRLKPGTGFELVKSSCLLCHSADYITTQPPLTRAQWSASVDKMRNRYGAPLGTNQLGALVDYLTLNYGQPLASPGTAPK